MNNECKGCRFESELFCKNMYLKNRKSSDDKCITKEIFKNKCERCGLDKTDKRYPIDVKYYERAKQNLCDCCIDVFDGNSWGYDSLKDLFGEEQANKILTLGFKVIPYGFSKQMIREIKML